MHISWFNFMIIQNYIITDNQPNEAPIKQVGTTIVACNANRSHTVVGAIHGHGVGVRQTPNIQRWGSRTISFRSSRWPATQLLKKRRNFVAALIRIPEIGGAMAIRIAVPLSTCPRVAASATVTTTWRGFSQGAQASVAASGRELRHGCLLRDCSSRSLSRWVRHTGDSTLGDGALRVRSSRPFSMMASSATGPASQVRSIPSVCSLKFEISPFVGLGFLVSRIPAPLMRVSVGANYTILVAREVGWWAF